jgi:small-conductance mechanosensitive channel
MLDHGVRVEVLLWWAGILLAAVVISRVVAYGLVWAMRRGAKRASSPALEVLAARLPEPLRWLLPAVALNAGIRLFPFEGPWVAATAHVVLIATMVCVGWLAYRMLKAAEEILRLHRTPESGHLPRAVATRLRALRNVGGFVIALITVGLSLMTFPSVRNLGAGVLASAGVAGIVVGFAAQNTLATVFAGVHLAIAQPVRIDDFVVVEGEGGYVEELKLTYVVVRLLDLRRMVVPITYFIDRPFQNWTRKGSELLGSVELRFDYTVCVDEVRAELARVLEGSEHWDGKVSKVEVTEAGEWTMLVRLQVSAKDRQASWDLRCEVREKMIAWAQRTHPDTLPSFRAAVDGARRAPRATQSLRAHLTSRART